jgi:glycosyltransferase involved in cell wall biosynthesis
MQRILYAPNAHQGGGRSLLLPLLEQIKNDESLWLMLDARLELPVDLQLQGKVIRVTRSIFGRLAAEWWLRNHLSKHSRVLAFGNLPPLLARCEELYVFIQNRYLVDPSPKWAGLPWKVVLRLKVERLWLRSFLQKNANLIVQTPSMQSTLLAGLNRYAELMPFIASTQQANLPLARTPAYDFLYVASGEPHKNHRNLVEAWVRLSKQEIFPHLALTLDSVRFPKLCQWIENQKAQYQLKISLLGELKYNEISNIYAESRALIYPSRYESFGLPLLEAVAAGLPVLAANESYVTEVVEPTAIFDARFSQSIVEAVKHFSYASAKINIGLLEANQFLQLTLYKTI